MKVFKKFFNSLLFLKIFFSFLNLQIIFFLFSILFTKSSLLFSLKDASLDFFKIKFPQCMAYDKKQKIYFISYLCGDPMKNHSKSYVSKIDKDMSKVLLEKFCDNLNFPQAMALSKKYLIVADQSDIKFFDRRKGDWQKTLSFGNIQSSCISDIVFDGKRFLYACDLFKGILIRIDLFRNMESTIMLGFHSKIKHPKKLFYNPRRKSLFVALYNGPLYEFNPQTKKIQRILSFMPFDPTGIVMDNDYNLYFSNIHNGGQIVKVRPNKTYTLFCKKKISPSHLFFSKQKNALFALSSNKNYIYKFSLSSS